MFKVHNYKKRKRYFTMLSREQKETMLNQILELMTAIAYDEPNAEIERLTAERDEAVAEFEKVSRKKVKLTEIDSVETGKTVFGGKVIVSQEDWENVSDLAKKEVVSQKQTKKLRKERDEAVQERDKLKIQLAAVSSELSEYKKKEENKRYFSREKQNAEAQRIKREEQLTRDLQKARAFITACGLSDDFARYKYNKTRGTELV